MGQSSRRLTPTFTDHRQVSTVWEHPVINYCCLFWLTFLFAVQIMEARAASSLMESILTCAIKAACPGEAPRCKSNLLSRPRNLHHTTAWTPMQRAWWGMFNPHLNVHTHSDSHWFTWRNFPRCAPVLLARGHVTDSCSLSLPGSSRRLSHLNQQLSKDTSPTSRLVLPHKYSSQCPNKNVIRMDFIIPRGETK